jgi:hypothetical protein
VNVDKTSTPKRIPSEHDKVFIGHASIRQDLVDVLSPDLRRQQRRFSWLPERTKNTPEMARMDPQG